MVTIKQVLNKKELKQFINFYYDLNSHNHAFIGDSYKNQRNLLRKDINPFFDHAEVCCFMAMDSDKVVGRIAVIKNHAAISKANRELAQFGFFDSIDDKNVAIELFDAAREKAREWGVKTIEGPENLSFNDSLGVLVDGFDHSPFYEMPYNPPYYDQLIRDCGFKKSTDLYAYYLASKDFPDRLLKARPVLKSRFERRGILVRNFNPEKYEEEVDEMAVVYNSAWVENQGFVPVTKSEFQYYFRKYKPFLDPDLIYLAEKEGSVIGFCLTLPNLNDVYSRLKRGRKTLQDRLFPGKQSAKINTIRIVAIGIESKFRLMGIDSYFYIKLFETANNKGYLAGEASRVLEKNDIMNNAMAKMDAQLYKRYRLYRKSI